MAKLKRFLLFFPLLVSAVSAPFESAEHDLIVNNRVLAAPVGRAITMFDVIRRLDMVFYRQYPELTDSMEARYQYYQMGWRQALSDMINADLMLADAEEKKIGVSDGDIREELEQQFGPNVVETIDKLGLTYDEAWEMMERELTVRQMSGFMVMGRAIAAVTPERLRAAYADYVAAQGKTEVWKYRVLSLSHRDRDESGAAALIAQDLLCSLEKLEDVRDELLSLREEGGLSPALSIRLTDPFSRKESEMAAAHRDVVCSLDPGESSDAIAQVSRVDGSTVYRIFLLEEVEDPGVRPFGEMAQELRMELLNVEAQKAESEYVARLRKRYQIFDEELNRTIPADLQPALLR